MPVLANGNIRTLHDVHRCMEYTGCVGVMSAESLLEDPALFSSARLSPEGHFRGTAGAQLLLEYLDLAEQYPTPMRMVTGHAFKMLGEPCYTSAGQLYWEASTAVSRCHELVWTGCMGSCMLSCVQGKGTKATGPGWLAVL